MYILFLYQYTYNTDILPDESDDEKIKHIELEETDEKSNNANNGKMEEQLDRNDDVGVDLEKSCTEETTENNATPKAHISDAQGNDTESEDTNTDIINTSNDSDDELSNNSGINEGDNKSIDYTYSTGYSLNSRRPKTDTGSTTTETEPGTTKHVTDDDKLASEGSNDTTEVSGESKIDTNSGVMNWEDDHRKEKQQSNELNEPVPDSLNETDTQMQRQHDSPEHTDERTRTTNVHYQIDDDKKEVGTKYYTRPPESKQGTKITVTIPDTKSFKPDDTTKHEAVIVQHITTPKQKTSVYNKSPATSSSNRSNPRPIKHERNLSPRDIVAKQRNESRQKSQSARYPSHRKSASGDGTISTMSRSSTARSSRPPSRPKTTLGFSTGEIDRF